MSKKTLLWSIAWFAVFSTQVLALGSEERSYRGKVFGKAVFERRMTLVPMVVCEESVCPESQPYWTLVLHQDTKRFELDHAFEMGREFPPEFLEIEGAIIRPGTRMVMDGWIRPLSENYALISEVKEIDIEMDMTSQSHQIAPTRERLPLWVCKNVDEVSVDGGRRLQVEVWSRRRNGSVADYEIRIFGQTHGEWKRIGHVPNTELRIGGDFISFYGATGNVEAELKLDHSSEQFDNVPASLEFKKELPGPTYRIPLEVRDFLKCDRRLVSH